MEVSVIGSSQAKVGKSDLAFRELGFCCLKENSLFSTCRICFGGNPWKKAAIRFSLKAIQSEVVPAEKLSGSGIRSKSPAGMRLFVGLPLDAVPSDCNGINHARAIAAGLKALKLLGVEGVELPVWWGIVEKDAMGKYDWSSYLAIADMIQKEDLKLHVSLCFHASKNPNIALPKWVSKIAATQPSIFFADRSGQQYEECLSLAVDDLPVLDGKTPIQVYQSFCESFKSLFLPFMGSTITGVSMGLGPDGELRYPSHHQLPSNKRNHGVGEFQCYDINMLSILKQHAEAFGNPLWGLGGPHDVPTYEQSPNSTNFFKDGGSWESSYGEFFLSWYADQLITHGDRLLSLAASTFSDSEVTIYGKLPLMHYWYKTNSHPSELTAGFYNTSRRDGYGKVVEMFAKNSCKMILPGMDMSDACQPQETFSSPELLLEQIMAVCRKQGVNVSGQNSSFAPSGFEQIKKYLSGDHVLDLFIYQRMGAYFFSPEHFPSFTEFVWSLSRPELHSDDLPAEEQETTDHVVIKSPESSMSMQAA